MAACVFYRYLTTVFGICRGVVRECKEGPANHFCFMMRVIKCLVERSSRRHPPMVDNPEDPSLPSAKPKNSSLRSSLTFI